MSGTDGRKETPANYGDGRAFLRIYLPYIVTVYAAAFLLGLLGRTFENSQLGLVVQLGGLLLIALVTICVLVLRKPSPTKDR
ncbi:MAG: hypothetical protein AAGD14_09160 [Planctomycetota bacterium]